MILSKSLKSIATSIALATLMPLTASSQQVISGVYTDYKGFWHSTVAVNSTDTTDASHMLLGFTYNNRTFSTGVADATLTAKGVSFEAANFQALSLGTAVLNSTGSVIGVADFYGGGAGELPTIPVTNDLGKYLNDGAHGLDLGTAIFNLPAATSLKYPVGAFKPTAIGDNIPDLIVTQVGQPPAAGSLDIFQFEDAAGNRIGNAVNISLSGISVVGTGKWKFYNPGTPITYNAGLRGSRPLRMVGFDFADFGLTVSQLAQAKRFVHKLSGQSDQAFIAYNTGSFTASIGTALPVTLLSFNAAAQGNRVALNWEVTDASNFDHFEVERSNGQGAAFQSLGKVSFDGWATGSYTFEDATPQAGVNYYRLKMIDENGSFSYSAVRSVRMNEAAAIQVFPNPASSQLHITTTSATSQVVLYNISGLPCGTSVRNGNQVVIDVNSLPQGMYTVRILEGSTVSTRSISIAH